MSRQSSNTSDRGRQRLLEKSARGILDAGRLSRLYKGIDIIGDIAIVKLPHECENEKFWIAENLLHAAPYLKVILRQVGPVEQQLRIRRLEWLAGEKRTETVHREFGCEYKLDVESVYFSPRLGGERKRVADLVLDGESVVNFFAGVGSFSIMIARHANPCRIYSLDVNATAARYHIVNNALNRVGETIDVICGDAIRVVATSLVGRADRVLLPLPELALSSLDTAKNALKNGHGAIHCYMFVDARAKDEASTRALTEFRQLAENVGVGTRNAQAHVVRSVGPCRYQVCLDIML